MQGLCVRGRGAGAGCGARWKLRGGGWRRPGGVGLREAGAIPERILLKINK